MIVIIGYKNIDGKNIHVLHTFPPSSLYQISFISVFKDIRSRTQSMEMERTGSTNFKYFGDLKEKKKKERLRNESTENRL